MRWTYRGPWDATDRHRGRTGRKSSPSQVLGPWTRGVIDGIGLQLGKAASCGYGREGLMGRAGLVLWERPLEQLKTESGEDLAYL